MKKSVKELQSKTVKELEKSVNSLHEEVAKLRLQQKVNPSKDTNIVSKKRKMIATLLTVITQKKELETLSNKK